MSRQQNTLQIRKVTITDRRKGKPANWYQVTVDSGINGNRTTPADPAAVRHGENWPRMRPDPRIGQRRTRAICLPFGR